MTAFSQSNHAGGVLAGFDSAPPVPARRPSRWALTNWPVRWKVVAIVLIPLLLAGTFGGLRIYTGVTEATDLRRIAERAELIPDINNYMAALEGAMVTVTVGGDSQSALAQFDERKAELQQRLETTDVVPDVRLAVTTLVDYGQALIDKVTANAVELRQRVTTYAPLLLTAETAITGSARGDTDSAQLQAEGLSRAIGARGQMAMQEMLVQRGAELPEPELRTSMMTLAGTEPSTVTGMGEVLGGASEEAATLRSEMVKRMGLLSNPAVPLPGNPELLQSQQVTRQIAEQMIGDTVTAIPAAVNAAADEQRTATIRDAVIVAVAMLAVVLLVVLVARSLIRPLRKLRDGALKVAHEDLAGEIDRVRAGGEPGPVTPLPVYTSEEVGQVAHAVDELHEQAVLLAGEQARLQMQVGDMFETLSRRSRSLVDQQLTLIDQLERDEEDPDRLESLFRLDHLAARMRRNGANLLVLSGAKVPREQADPVAVSAIINAAASEVEDYTRVVTGVVPDSEIMGSAAGDLVHLLAELLDNGLRYSPPISQVRVSAVHTGNGALVIEVSDIGLGMTESHLRVANSRLQSGGEVTPYTARHMGLFVVGRLAHQHGLVVRLRSTFAGEPDSGTTAGIYVPGELVVAAAIDDFGPQEYGTPADAHAGIATALALDEEHHPGSGAPPVQEHRNGHAPVPIGLLPQRDPGASGIADLPAALNSPVQRLPVGQPDWPQDSMPPQTSPWSADEQAWPHSGVNGQPVGETDRAEAWTEPAEPDAAAEAVTEPDVVAEPVTKPDVAAKAATEPDVAAKAATEPDVAAKAAPTNTAAFFASRAQAASNGAHPPASADVDEHHGDTPAGETSQIASADDAIYQSMLSEFLIDPTEVANSSDLDWQSVWDHGWSAAAAADEAPVRRRTEDGLPMRDPGARLVPGGVGVTDEDAPLNGGHRNGGAHSSKDADDRDNGVASADTGAQSLPQRDPNAVRASISNHFGGVHAGRAHARDTRGIDNE